ncbi:MAG: hypothetical protein ACOYOX_09355, partial [Limnohabitans sp.]
MSDSRIGMVVIWNDIKEEMRDEFVQWHSTEHLPERVSIPGFISGQRWYGEHASPQYLTTYVTQNTGVLTSDAYIQRLNDPTPWTLKTVAAFRHTCRAAGEVIWEYGSKKGYGGHILAIRITELEDLTILTEYLNSLANSPEQCFAELLRARLVLTTPTASQLPTAERAVRTGDQNEPHMVLLLESFSGEAPLRHA